MPGKTKFGVMAGMMGLAALSAPLLGQAGFPLPYLVLRSVFSSICHQAPERSLMIGGFAVVVCVRCLGIYFGAAAGMLLTLRRAPHTDTARRICYAACAANLFDIVAESLHWHGNLPALRLLLGLVLGISTALLVQSDDRHPRGTEDMRVPAPCKSTKLSAE